MEKELPGTNEFEDVQRVTSSGDFDLVGLLFDLGSSGCRNRPAMAEIDGMSTDAGFQKEKWRAGATFSAESPSAACDSTHDSQLPFHIRGQAECWEVPR